MRLWLFLSLSVFVAVGPLAVSARESGSVLVLNSDCADSVCTVGSYGAGFVVKIDESKSTVYVLTALHVINGAEKIFVLYDPSFFPLDYISDLKAGIIPSVINASLAAKGHPEPTSIYSGNISDNNQNIGSGSVRFPGESFVLGDGDSQYVVLPQSDRLELYHLLQATAVNKSTPELDVALLAIDNFPSYESSPVLYMSTPDAISTGTKVTTKGCDCGLDEGISQAEVQGLTVSGNPGFLTYESDLVAPGFSGGPVFIGKNVVAMNLTQDLKTGTRIQARLASSFKNLVDEWIGLQRMRIDLVIESPEGAKDGVVSTGQEFVLRAEAKLDPKGQVLAPGVAIFLNLPDPYKTQDNLSELLTAGSEKKWLITAPGEVTPLLPIKLVNHRPAVGNDSSPLTQLEVETEAGLHLKGLWVDSPRDGAGLFLNDEFQVSIMFPQPDTPVGDFLGTVSLDFARFQFVVLEGAISQDLIIGKNITWKLKAKDISVGAPVAFTTSSQDLDRNGKPVKVDLPDPIRFSVEEDWGFRFYTGIGRFDLEDSSAETKPELEMGIKFRVANLLQRGIPLRLAFSAGYGVDDMRLADFDSVSGSSLIGDVRYWGGVGFSMGLGNIETCLDVGHITLDRFIESNVPPEEREKLEKADVHSLFLRPGIEFGLSPMIALYAGARFIYDIDDTEYFLQVRMRRGR